MYTTDRRSAAEEEEAQRTGGFYSQPGPAAQSGKETSGGVGKYLGDGGVTVLPKLPSGNGGVGPTPHPKESPALQQQAVEGKKKAAPGTTSGFKDFSGW